ncbi:MAG: hypothetical protein FWG04_06110 [Desulfovibrionaceae bacterium]|nr:hypothetical protein [Desulfovibrionaceae bacterium]
MLIRNRKAFIRGLLLLLSFAVVLVIFFMPVFPAQEEGGNKTNGLVFADHLFNTLSKGSSLFLDPSMQARGNINRPTRERTEGKSVDLTVPFKTVTGTFMDTTGVSRELNILETALTLLKAHNFEVTAADKSLIIKGELYPLLQSVLADALSIYHNNPEEVSARHNGLDGRAVMKTWWHLLSSMIQPMQRAGQVDEASAVATVISKGIEPSYNFFGITPMRVTDNIPLVAGFLIFYVLYTMWYGFAIFELFEGVGLSMKKGVKQEQ